MKYLMKLKFFTESKIDNSAPQPGNYAVCKQTSMFTNFWKPLNDFLIENVGKILHTNYIVYSNQRYIIQYENIPEHVKSFFNKDDTEFPNSHYFNKNDILFWSKNKKDCELFIDQIKNIQKYNL